MFILLSITVLFSCTDRQDAGPLAEDSALRPVYLHVLQGDMRSALEMLDTISASRLTREERKLRRGFYRRFRDRRLPAAAEEPDPLINSTVDAFRKYWKTVLMKEAEPDTAGRILEEQLVMALSEHSPYNDMSRDSIRAHLQQYLSEAVSERGYFCNALNFTANLYDLFLWKDQLDTIYSVTLPDTQVAVNVILMQDFVTIGWAEYATLDQHHAGGWAGRDKLYCVRKTYDLDSENFRVSYLVHEAQHLADYHRYPRLTQPDLEYRAKLAELSYAESTSSELLKNFLFTANHDRDHAHPFANYCVMRDLSQSLFDRDLVKDAGMWEELDKANVRKTAASLLKKNTHDLNMAGPKQIREYMK